MIKPRPRSPTAARSPSAIIRACRELGIEIVAVYSDADARAPHVACWPIARSASAPRRRRESYLSIPTLIIDAARETGADAFIPATASCRRTPRSRRRATDAGLVFIGPPADVIERMGSKIAARR